jgi:hypothetical protein
MLLRALVLAAAFTGPALAQTSPHVAPVGVPECDALISAYDRCVGANLSSTAREQAGAAVQRIGEGWRLAAQRPDARASLGPQCAQMSQMMRQSMATPSCRF